MWGTWTVGTRSSLLPIALPKALKHSDLLIEATVRAFVPRPELMQNVTVRANGAAVATWTLRDSEPGHVLVATVPSSVLEGHPDLSLTFDISNPRSPAVLGVSSDGRELGLGLMHLKIQGIDQ